MTQQHDFYTARAEEARAGALEADLDHVRDRWLHAAASWDALAARAHKSDVFRVKEEARRCAARAT